MYILDADQRCWGKRKPPQCRATAIGGRLLRLQRLRRRKESKLQPSELPKCNHQKKWVYSLDISCTSISCKIVSRTSFNNSATETCHLERVQFLFNLLSEHGRQAVASCNLTPPIVLSTRPGIMELYTGAEADIASGNTSGGAGYTLGISTRELC